jgi:hypothetical protein
MADDVATQAIGAFLGLGRDPQQRMAGLIEGVGLTGPSQAGSGVIESATLEITTQVRKLITGAGGLAIVSGTATGAWAAIADNTPLAIALAAGVALVLVATILGIVKVADGDVKARAAATGDQLHARAEVVSSALKAGSGSPSGAGPGELVDDLRTALATYGDRTEVETVDGWSRVRSAAWSGTGLRVHLASGDAIDPTEATAFRVTFAAPTSASPAT